ncbi:MAG: polysaccharide deacetylase family protein [Bryobacterales bacterium]|nr:polysaccharide deacetylase family protein [Bryobacterales bacterium]
MALHSMNRILPALAGFCLLIPGALRAQTTPGGFRWPDGKRVAVSFSFDDARTSQVDAGLALFEKHGVKATFYVSPRSVEKRLEGWKKAVAAGHEIGNHSNTHPCTANFGFSAANALEDYTLARMDQEFDNANRAIERMLGVRAATFAYPCGQKFVGRGTEVKSYVPLVARKFLAGRGFRDEMANDPKVCDLAQLLGVESDGLSFEQMREMTGTAAARGGWLVFAGHEIGAPGRQTTQAAALEQFLRYAADPANGIWIDTVRAVGEYVRTHRGGRP